MTFTSLASSSRGNAYVVSDGETTLLLECGLSFRELQKRLGYGVADITACLVSHEHQDHAKAAAQMLKAGVPVYMSEGTAAAHKDAMDADFRRLQYVRYADDFLISVIGSKSECETIKADITQFMREQLKLELSDEKTLITHAQDKAKFLGYEIFIRKSDAVKRNRDGVLKRDFNGAVVLTLNSAVIQKKLTEYNALEVRNIDGKDIWWSKPRRYMTPMKPEDILAQYNAEIRGLYNYYSLAANVSKECASFAFIMKMSMFKTLGWKLNTSARKVRQKYQKDKDFVIPYNDAKGKQKYRVFYNEGFKKRNAQFDVDYDKLPQTMYVPYPSLVERLKDGRCELCGKDGKVVMHHVRTLTKLKGNNEWEKLMLQRHRKTLVVCEDCNSMIQNYGKE